MQERVEKFTRALEALFNEHRLGISVENNGATLCDLDVSGDQEDAVVKLGAWCDPMDYKKFPGIKPVLIKYDKNSPQ